MIDVVDNFQQEYGIFHLKVTFLLWHMQHHKIDLLLQKHDTNVIGVQSTNIVECDG